MGLAEQITEEVNAITCLMDDIVEQVQTLKLAGVDVTGRQDFQTKVREMNSVIGAEQTQSSTEAATDGSTARKRLSSEDVAAIDGVITGIINSADSKKGIHYSALKAQYEEHAQVKLNNWQDKLQQRLSKMKKDKSVKYVAGKTNKEGGTYFKK